MNRGVLKARGKALATEARELRQQIRKTGRRISYAANNSFRDNYYKDHDPFVNCLAAQQRAKQAVKVEARHVHIAKAALKGTPFEKVERNAKASTGPVVIKRLMELTGWTEGRIIKWATASTQGEQMLDDLLNHLMNAEITVN